MGGRIWKVKNLIRCAVYAGSANAFKGNIPVLSQKRSSWEQLVKFLLENVIDACYDPKQKVFRPRFGPQVSYQGVKSDALELTLRPFIGLSFLARHSACPDIERIYLDVIRQGVDPKSRHFWGSLPTNQLLIENASLWTGILLNPIKFWEALTTQEQTNLLDYAVRCVGREFVDNNWLWSKVFHLLFIQTFTKKQNIANEIRQVLKRIDDFYTGDGWYRDGLNQAEFRYDHYNSWAMHYYGLLFCSLAGAEFEDIKIILRKRFLDFKRSYLLIFSSDYLPVAWGRSLIYRFGMLSCFGVALENNLLDADEVRDIKAIAVDTVNNFFRQGILDQHGLLTMGYTQVNKNILEGYSGAASPYWAVKGLSFLMLDSQHIFWNSLIDTKAQISKVAHVKTCGFSIQQYSDGHSLLINAGIGSRIYSQKYNRFAFSNVFPLSFNKHCLDNCLTVFEGSKSKVFDIIDEVVPIEDGVTGVRLRISSLPGITAVAHIVTVAYGYLAILKIDTKDRYRFRFGGFCFPVFDTQQKQITLLKVYKSGKGRLGFQSVNSRQNTLGIKGRVKYFESFLEVGSNELVFGAFASLSARPCEPTYQELDGKVVIKAEGFLKTFNQVTL